MQRVDVIKETFPQLTPGVCRFSCKDCLVFLYNDQEAFSCSKHWAETSSAENPNELILALSSLNETINQRDDK